LACGASGRSTRPRPAAISSRWRAATDGALGALQAGQLGGREVEDAAAEEDQGADCLVDGGRGDAALGGEVVQEGDDVVGTEGVEADEGADPVDVGFLGARGVIQAAKSSVDGFREGHVIPIDARGPDLRAGAKIVTGRRGRWYG
jgi:hypothetical protein